MARDTRRRDVLRGVAAVGAIGLSGCVGGSGGERDDRLPRFVAHAMGGIDGDTYTNSLEAWERNYENGCRYFEVDLWRTPDDRLVAFHEGLREKHDLPEGFTGEQFVESQFAGKYTPLDARRLATLLERADDWRLVTDIKKDFFRCLGILCKELSEAGIEYRDRVLPQIYNTIYDLPVTRLWGFDEVVFTLYRSSLTNEEVLEAVREHDAIVAVTMSEDRYSGDFVRRLSELEVPSYVHTINDEEKIESYFESGVHGVYTDFGCGSKR